MDAYEQLKKHFVLKTKERHHQGGVAKQYAKPAVNEQPHKDIPHIRGDTFTEVNLKYDPDHDPMAKTEGVEPKEVSREFEVPYVAGYSKSGDKVYIDKRIPKHLKLKDGRTVDVDRLLFVHESVEKLLMNTLGYKYKHAHSIALAAEKRACEKERIPWDEYDAFMQKYIKNSGKLDQPTPPDLDLEPEVDEGDTAEMKEIQRADLKKSSGPSRRVASVAVLNGNKLLMGIRNDNGRWTLPGGHLNEGEDPAQGALRELWEEAGIEANGLTFMGKKDIISFKGDRVEVNCYYTVGHYLTNKDNDPDHEIKQWYWVDCSNGLPPEIAGNLHSPKNVTLHLLGLQNEEQTTSSNP